MVIFHSYVKLPEGKPHWTENVWLILFWLYSTSHQLFSLDPCILVGLSNIDSQSLNPIKKSRHLPKCTSKLVLLLVPPRATITSPLYSLYILQTRVGYILYQSVSNIHMRSLHWWFVQSSCKRTSMFPVSQSIDNMPIGLSPISHQILSLDLDIPIISRYIPSSPQNSYVVPSKKSPSYPENPIPWKNTNIVLLLLDRFYLG